MKFFGLNIPFKSDAALPQGCPSKPGAVYLTPQDMMQLFGGRTGTIDCSTLAGQMLAMTRCSVLSSVIIKKVNAIKNANFWMKDANGNDVLKPKELERMLRPNPLQTLRDFMGQVEYYMQVHGQAFICRIASEGMPGDFDIYTLPNNSVHKITSLNAGRLPFDPDYDVISYRVSIGGTILTIDRDDVFIIRDLVGNAGGNTGSNSRMVPLQNSINTFVASYESVQELMVNRGMLGIISLTSDDDILKNQNIPTTKEELKTLREAIKHYGTMSDQMKHMVTPFRASYTPVSSNIVDLGLTDVQRNCRKDIADQYQVPSVLLDVENTPYANTSEAKKILYNDAIIPEAEHIMDTLNRIYGYEDFRVAATYDHLEFYQEAKRQQAAGVSAFSAQLIRMMEAGILSQNEVRAEWDKFII